MSGFAKALQQRVKSHNSLLPYGYGNGIATPSHLENYISQVQFERLAHDIGMWRNVIKEAESVPYPMRAAAQRLYMDCARNLYVKSVVKKWKELTTQRDYIVYQKKGSKIIESTDATQALTEQAWMGDYIEYLVEALLCGYTYTTLGDIEKDSFPNISVIPRENIRPDGIGDIKSPILTNMVYMTDGVRINDDRKIKMFNHYFGTKSDDGHMRCGLGMYYEIGWAEIHLRHISEWNMDFIEQFGQPIRKGWTNKTGKQRRAFESMLANGASSAWVLLDKTTDDNIEYEYAQSIGTAWKVYDNAETRLEGKICQFLLGHTDAMSTSPDKLGGNQKSNKDGDNINLVQQALNAKQIDAGNYVIRKFNEVSVPAFRDLGKFAASKTIRDLVPQGHLFGLKNDVEQNEIQGRINNHRKNVAIWTKDLNAAGYNVGVKELENEMNVMGGGTLNLTEAPPETKMYQERKTEAVIERTGEGSGSESSES